MTSSPAVRIRTPRLENWDRLRVLAAIDIVGLHLTGEHPFLGLGLPIFLILAIGLGVSQPEAPPTPHFLSRRADRILWPWVFWALALAALRVFFTWTTDEPPFGWLEWEMLVYGPRIHLWFLPFIFVAGLAAHAVHRRTDRLPVLPMGFGAFVLSALSLPVFPEELYRSPSAEWVFSSPALPIGFGVGRLMAAAGTLERLRLLLTAGLAMFVLVAGLVVLVVPRLATFALLHGGGLAVLVAAAWLPNRPGPLTARIVPLILGTYVLHPIVHAVVTQPVADLLGGADQPAVVMGLAFLATLGLVALLRRTRVQRFL